MLETSVSSQDLGRIHLAVLPMQSREYVWEEPSGPCSFVPVVPSACHPEMMTASASCLDIPSASGVGTEGPLVPYQRSAILSVVAVVSLGVEKYSQILSLFLGLAAEVC